MRELDILEISNNNCMRKRSRMKSACTLFQKSTKHYSTTNKKKWFNFSCLLAMYIFSSCIFPSKVSHHFSSFAMRFLLSWDSVFVRFTSVCMCLQLLLWFFFFFFSIFSFSVHNSSGLCKQRNKIYLD